MVIPDHIIKNNQLNDGEKIMYALIVEYANAYGVCIKSSEFFTQFFNGGTTVRTIQNHIRKLRQLGLIGMANYERVKNALWIVKKEDFTKAEKQEEPQKIGNYAYQSFAFAEREKFFAENEKNSKNDYEIQPITNNTVGINNLVLVSKENNNKNNNARTCAGAREEIDNPSIFSNYERLQSYSARAPAHEDWERQDYIKRLFKGFFEFYPVGSKFYQAGLEIVDTMIEAVKGCNNPLGFRFEFLQYDKTNPVEDLILNLTGKEFEDIVKAIGFKKGIENRPAYIFGAIVNCGQCINWRKANELVRKGWPWTSWVPSPTNKVLSKTIFSTQKIVEREKQREAYMRELENTGQLAEIERRKNDFGLKG